MKVKIFATVILLLSSAAFPAAAQSSADKITVSSLLAQDYLVVGAMSGPSGGAGLFLRKATKLYFCFVTETPKSATVATDYCKPVE